MSDLISKEKLKDDIAVLLERNKKLIDEWLANCIDDVIDEQPTIEAVPKNMVFHVDIFDDMHETYTEEELTLEEMLDKYTDEGYPNALNALDALEEEV